MASANPNALLGPVAEDLNLLTPILSGNLGGYTGAIQHRLTNLNVFTVYNHQHIVQTDAFADIAVQLLNFKNCSWRNPILLATGSNYCVHALLLCTASENSDLDLAALQVTPQELWIQNNKIG